MAKILKSGRGFIFIGLMFDIAGVIWLFTGRHIAIGLSLLSLGTVLLVIGSAAKRKSDAAPYAGPIDTRSKV